MEAWRETFRGVAVELSTKGLQALAEAIRTDDPRLIQGNTTHPLSLLTNEAAKVEGACALGFCGWSGGGLETVGQVRDYFGDVCKKADELLGDGYVGELLDWFDETPREQMREALLPEVELALSERTPASAP